MCRGKNMGYFPKKTICNESIHGDLYTHDKDCHYEMDDHKLYTFVYHVLTLANMVLVL